MINDQSENERTMRGRQQQGQSCLTRSCPEHQRHLRVPGMSTTSGYHVIGDIRQDRAKAPHLVFPVES